MNQKQLKRSAFLALIMCAILLMTLSAATFAWFTNNSQVETTRVTGRTATQDVELQISGKGGSEFSGAQEAEITQVNETKLTYLMPVSTADLETFVQCPVTVDGYATNFTKTENEANYFHGRVYLRAVVQGGSDDARIALYLDESKASGGLLAEKEDADSLILNAARLGLVFNENSETALIFRLSEEENKTDDRALNTKLDGEVQDEDTVLTWNGSSAEAKKDTSVLISDYAVSENGEKLPQKPIFVMEQDTIYPVDIYFYLEGCDPDCTEAISFDGNDLHLAFFGVLS